jgi:outer membrane biosynthesis protein TonB
VNKQRRKKEGRKKKKNRQAEKKRKKKKREKKEEKKNKTRQTETNETKRKSERLTEKTKAANLRCVSKYGVVAAVCSHGRKTQASLDSGPTPECVTLLRRSNDRMAFLGNAAHTSSAAPF